MFEKNEDDDVCRPRYTKSTAEEYSSELLERRRVIIPPVSALQLIKPAAIDEPPRTPDTTRLNYPDSFELLL